VAGSQNPDLMLPAQKLALPDALRRTISTRPRCLYLTIPATPSGFNAGTSGSELPPAPRSLTVGPSGQD